MTTEEDGNSLDGTPPEKFAPELRRRGADVIGINCSVGPRPCWRRRADGGAVDRRALSAQPNAGRPRDIEGRDDLSVVAGIHGVVRAPLRRARRAPGRRLLRHDAGAHPADQGGRRAALAPPAACAVGLAPSAAAQARRGRDATAPPVPRDREIAARATRSAAAFVVCGRTDAAEGRSTATDVVEHARLLKIRGVDAVSIADGTASSARMSALSLAVLVQQQTGIETVLQYACRDRNLLGMQSDLLGAHAMGIRNIVVVTGDARKVGDYPDATAVFDVDSIGLTNVGRRGSIAAAISAARRSARRRRFTSASSVNPTAPDLDDELRRFEYKVEAGAEFAVTQPVFDVGGVRGIPRADLGSARMPIVPGLARSRAC